MRLREFIINLQTEEEIVNSSIPAPKPLVGIYFLIQDKKIVYVGKSRDIKERIAEHTKPHSDKKFDSFSYIELPEEFLDYNRVYDINEKENIALNNLEGLYILKYKPKYNINPGTVNYVSFDDYSPVKMKVRLGNLEELYNTSGSDYVKLKLLIKKILFEITGSEEVDTESSLGTLIELLQYQSPKRYEYRVNGKTTNTTRVNPYSPHWKLGGQ